MWRYVGNPYFSMAAFSRLQLEARRECVAGVSWVGAKLTGEQRRLGLAEVSSAKDNDEEKEMISGFV
jgi:hypothetical protein